MSDRYEIEITAEAEVIKGTSPLIIPANTLKEGMVVKISTGPQEEKK